VPVGVPLLEPSADVGKNQVRKNPAFVVPQMFFQHPCH
jgi:hypothetical protein